MTNEVHLFTVLAQAADEAFDAALTKGGFKSRWDWDSTLPSQDPTGDIKHAYRVKVLADECVHEAWEASRKA